MVKKLGALVTLLALMAGSAQAGHCSSCPTSCGGCGVTPSVCAPADPCAAGYGACGTVQTTVMVPQYVTQKQKVLVTEYKHETKEREVAYTELVSRVEKKSRIVNFTETEWHVKTESYAVQKPVVEVVDQPYTVNVPVVEKKTGVRKVNKPVYKTVEQPYTVLVPVTEAVKGVRAVHKPVKKVVDQVYTVHVPYTEVK